MMILAAFRRYPVEMTLMRREGCHDFWNTAKYKNVFSIDTYIIVLQTCYIDRLKITLFNILHADLHLCTAVEMPYLCKF